MNVTQVPQRWDVFCRVVDNLGDAAILWRLARQLAVEHQCRVRLFIDQPAVLQQLVPGAGPGQTIDGVALLAMPGDAAKQDASATNNPDRVDVVVSGFHAPLPAPYRRRMTPRRQAWINLEYLSAEPWVDNFHGLPSPQPDGLTQHYFYPGFTARSGGLLREADLLARREAFLADAGAATRFLADIGVVRRDDETLASLLCYPDAPLDALARQLAGSDARLHLVVPLGATGGAPVPSALAGASNGQVRVTQIPFLAQCDYDRLLWTCDLNFVRGEDSWIRAVWSGRPFVWQIYKQADAIHLRKLEAFLQLLAPAVDDGAAMLARACRWWNDVPGTPAGAMVALVSQPAPAGACVAELAARLAGPDLATRLCAFASAIRLQDASPALSAGKL